MNFKNIGFGLGAFAVGVLGFMMAAVAVGSRQARASDDAADDTVPAADRGGRGPDGASEGHVPTDLMGDRHPGVGDRAAAAFRPDPTATPTPEEREALRPATGPAPTMVGDRGDI